MAELFQIRTPCVMMHLEPSDSAQACNQLLYGETVEILGENSGNWVKAQATHDGYEGYIPASVLETPYKANYRVLEPETFIFSEPDFKSPVLSSLFLGSKVSATKNRQAGFRELENSGWVFEAHISSLDAKGLGLDFVETALKFKHTPYLWGGRSFHGVDCSGLVQITLMDAGIDCPRDTKDQVCSIGQAVEFGDTIQYGSLQRGDFVFFERHVGIMLDKDNILNATSRHMKTVIEKLDDLVTAYDGILAVRRILTE